VATAAAVPVQSGARTHYSPRGLDPLRRLFCQRFPAFQASYEKRYAAFFGTFRLPLIARAASAFRLCGDWSQGIARIRCPDCGYALFRPFSCKGFFLQWRDGRAVGSAPQPDDYAHPSAGSGKITQIDVRCNYDLI
jgi:hypothetical protein